MSHNYTLEERAKYDFKSFSQDELISLLGELDSWRNLDIGDTPEEAQATFEELETMSCQCNNEDHCNFDDYKQFFDTVVDQISDCTAGWPCAEPWQSEVHRAVYDVIEAGLNAQAGVEE